MQQVHPLCPLHRLASHVDVLPCPWLATYARPTCDHEAGPAVLYLCATPKPDCSAWDDSKHLLRLKLELTEREALVLVCLAYGMSNKAIASLLGRAVNTARTHVQNVMRKTGVERARAGDLIQHVEQQVDRQHEVLLRPVRLPPNGSATGSHRLRTQG